LNDQMLRTGQATRFERTESIVHGLKGGGGSIILEQASAAALPHPDASFDVGTSINIGCNLPTGVFEAHFKEAHRVAKSEGTLIVTAPNSLTTVFTDGANSEDIQSYIDEKW